MIIVYDKKSKKVIDNTGTNSAFPDNSHITTDDLGYPSDSYSFLSLHDLNDSSLINKFFQVASKNINGTSIFILLDEEKKIIDFVSAPELEVLLDRGRISVGETATIKVSSQNKEDLLVTYEEKGLFKIDEPMRDGVSELEFASDIPGIHTIKVSTENNGSYVVNVEVA